MENRIQTNSNMVQTNKNRIEFHRNLEMLEFDKIVKELVEYAVTQRAKEQLTILEPYLSELELKRALRDTSEARFLLDEKGTPPIPAMEGVEELIKSAESGAMLLPEQLESIAGMLYAVKRLHDFLVHGADSLSVGLAYHGEELKELKEVREEILRMIRNGYIDDYATESLKSIRRSIAEYSEKIRNKAERLLKEHKEYFSESFVVNRNGHICLPVKKEYKAKMSGTVIDLSASGSTCFIEPAAVSKLCVQLESLKIDEDKEECRILYELSAMIAEVAQEIYQNLEVIVKLDTAFAKGKLSVFWKAKEPQINTVRKIVLKEARHPLLKPENCVPLDFQIGTDQTRGIVITGPNTGGKTVAIKTVGLISLIAQCGLHVPCEQADICMNNQILCDIGDGQNMTENLSTFSSHITNILSILRKVGRESLVILDELGSGTDPAEGMGIAIAILEELKKSNCLFLATTHYPEIKSYADKGDGIVNARMEFDRETLRPKYRMEIGKAGESCALYIAARLGMPREMIERAELEAYGETQMQSTMHLEDMLNKEFVPAIQKQKESKAVNRRADGFNLGDCVMIYPDHKLGIVAKTADTKGELIVQIKNEKFKINHKRLKLHVAAEQMYPEEYDFSIVFDTVANRKARKKMGKGYQGDLEIREE